MGPKIAFNQASSVGNEKLYFEEVLKSTNWTGGGLFSDRCQAWLEQYLGAPKALLTHSCTGALEMAAHLANIGPGDEVIMPSFTFVSTANAFVLNGGVPVFVDVCDETMNLDPALVEAAVTPKTKAICPVHYAGVSCDMEALNAIAKKHNLIVIEDAAQALMATDSGVPVGTQGAMSTFSFHSTKNIGCGEGGALVLNDEALVERAQIIWQKGTNRSQFMEGQVDKYSWKDIGSSFLPSEFTAAVLLAQFEKAQEITGARKIIWNQYFELLQPLVLSGQVSLPKHPSRSSHNGHIFSLFLKDNHERNSLLKYLGNVGVQGTFHYVPLHLSTAGIKFGRASGDLPLTENLSGRLLRLPLWLGMDRAAEVVQHVVAFFKL